MADEQFPAAATALEEYQSIEEQMASPEVVSNPDLSLIHISEPTRPY